MNTNEDISKYYLVRLCDVVEDPLNFELAIPEVCQMSAHTDVAQLQEPYVRLGSFRSPESPRLEIEVRITFLPREINAGDFAELSMTLDGAKVVQRRDWPDTHGCQAELIVTQDRAGDPWLCRTRVVKDGRRLYQIDAACPESEYAECEKQCAVPVMSFRLLNPENKTSVEELHVWSSSPSPDASFRYPASWALRQFENQEGRAGILLENFTEQGLAGTMTIDFHRCAADTPSPRYFRSFADRMKHQGLRLGGAAVVAWTPPAGFAHALAYAPRALKDGKPWCACACLLQANEELAMITINGPGRGTDPWTWAVNKRAFEIAYQSLVVGA